MPVTIFYTAKKAKAFGCTHRARFMGIVPGYVSDDGLWVPVSDLLAPVEDLLSFIWCSMRQMRGEEPDFMFVVGKKI